MLKIPSIGSCTIVKTHKKYSTVFPIEILSERQNAPPPPQKKITKSEGQMGETGGHNIQVANNHSLPFLLKNYKQKLPSF